MISQSTSFNDLPVDILLEISKHLDWKSAASLAQTSKGVNEALHHDLEAKKKIVNEALPSKKWYKKGMASAVKTNDIVALKTYLKAGVNPNIYNLSGKRMLSIALKHGSSETVKLLVDYGADMHLGDVGQYHDSSVLSTCIKEAERTALFHHLAQHPKLDLLFEVGAKIQSLDDFRELIALPDYADLLERAIENGSDLFSLRGADGQTVLHASASVRNVEVLRFILGAMPDLLNIRDDSGENALTVAAHRRYNNDQSCFYLLDQGIELANGGSAELRIATHTGDASLLRRLLTRPEVDVNSTWGFYSPFRYAFEKRNFEIMGILAEHEDLENDEITVREMVSFYQTCDDPAQKTQMSNVLQKLGIEH